MFWYCKDKEFLFSLDRFVWRIKLGLLNLLVDSVVVEDREVAWIQSTIPADPPQDFQRRRQLSSLGILITGFDLAPGKETFVRWTVPVV